MKITQLLGALVGTLVAVAATPVSAGYSWSFAKSACTGLKSGTTDAYTNCASTGSPSLAPDAKVSAYSNTGSSGALEQGYVGAYSSDPANLGVVNKYESPTGVPDHSMDSGSGYYDSLLVQFNAAVKLTSLSLGWKQTDSDITVMAYTGTGAPTLSGGKYANLTSSGWTLVGHYQNLSDQSATAINAGNYASSYWLIGAYNPLVGGAKSWTSGDDFVKLKMLAGDTLGSSGNVAEPASLALAGFALAGVAGMRRRKKLN